MQPYTHVALGALAGVGLFPHNPFAIGACIVGAGLPDVPIAFQAVVDKLKGRVPFANESEDTWWFLAKELTHSPLLWALSFAAGYFLEGFAGTLLMAFAIGVFTHYFSDILTHCDPIFRPTDQSLAWPFYQMGLVRKLGGLFTNWEYRQKPETLKPKLPELQFLVWCMLMTGLILFTAHCPKPLSGYAILLMGVVVSIIALPIVAAMWKRSSNGATTN